MSSNRTPSPEPTPWEPDLDHVQAIARELSRATGQSVTFYVHGGRSDVTCRCGDIEWDGATLYDAMTSVVSGWQREAAAMRHQSRELAEQAEWIENVGGAA